MTDHLTDPQHTCHWPGCTTNVAPKLWGCRGHWFVLPENLRKAIWETYRPGQEIDKQPSAAYIEVANNVQAWIRLYIMKRQILFTLKKSSYLSLDETKQVEYAPAVEALLAEEKIATAIVPTNMGYSQLRVTLTAKGKATANRMRGE